MKSLRIKVLFFRIHHRAGKLSGSAVSWPRGDPILLKQSQLTDHFDDFSGSARLDTTNCSVFEMSVLDVSFDSYVSAASDIA